MFSYILLEHSSLFFNDKSANIMEMVDLVKHLSWLFYLHGEKIKKAFNL